MIGDRGVGYVRQGRGGFRDKWDGQVLVGGGGSSKLSLVVDGKAVNSQTTPTPKFQKESKRSLKVEPFPACLTPAVLLGSWQGWQVGLPACG